MLTICYWSYCSEIYDWKICQVLWLLMILKCIAILYRLLIFNYKFKNSKPINKRFKKHSVTVVRKQ